MDRENSNGESGVEHREVDTVILTYDRAADKLDVGGKCHSYDLMLDILARATRNVESKWRVERAIELQNQLAQAARDAAIAAQIRGRG